MHYHNAMVLCATQASPLDYIADRSFNLERVKSSYVASVDSYDNLICCQGLNCMVTLRLAYK